MASELTAGAVEGFDESLKLDDATNDAPPIVDNKGGVLGRLSVND